MTKKVLVTFGDSWTYGSELFEETRADVVYGKVLAALMGYDAHINLGKPASGIGEMVLALDDFLGSSEYSIENQYFFVFGVTTSARGLGYSSITKEWFEVIPLNAHDSHREEIVKFFTSKIMDTRYQFTLANIYLAAIQAACVKYQVKFLMFGVFESLNYPIDAGRQLVDVSCFYKHGKSISEELGYPKQECITGYSYLCEALTGNKYVTPNYTHPNALGHAYMAELLYNWITTHIDV